MTSQHLSERLNNAAEGCLSLGHGPELYDLMKEAAFALSERTDNALAPGERKPGEIAGPRNDAVHSDGGKRDRASQEQAQPAEGATFSSDKWETAPTPRTDAEVINATFPDADVVAAGFCRMLERELEESKDAEARTRERLETILSATLPHDLIYKLHGWTGQLAEQPPSRVAPGIAQAAKRLHDELQLYVGVQPRKDK